MIHFRQVYPTGTMKGQRWRIYLTSILVAAVAATVTILFYPKLGAALSNTFTLAAKVSCAGSPVEGVWVESDSDSKGFATFDGVNVADGLFWSRYSKPGIRKGASYSLNVGCGRNFFTGQWFLTARSASFTSERLALLCNDIHPALEWLGVKSYKHIFKLLKAFKGKDYIEADYETCVEVPQNSQLAPVKTAAPVSPLTPAPVATLRTLAPVLTKTIVTAPPPPPPPSLSECTQTEIGTVCVRKTNNGYDASFDNASADSLVDFNLETNTGTYGDDGAFWSAPHQKNSYFFAVGYKSWARVCLYSRDYKFSPICTPKI